MRVKGGVNPPAPKGAQRAGLTPTVAAMLGGITRRVFPSIWPFLFSVFGDCQPRTAWRGAGRVESVRPAQPRTKARPARAINAAGTEDKTHRAARSAGRSGADEGTPRPARSTSGADRAVAAGRVRGKRPRRSSATVPEQPEQWRSRCVGQ